MKKLEEIIRFIIDFIIMIIVCVWMYIGAIYLIQYYYNMLNPV